MNVRTCSICEGHLDERLEVITLYGDALYICSDCRDDLDEFLTKLKKGPSFKYGRYDLKGKADE